MQVHTANVEREFGPQHFEETADMLGRLGECPRHQADSAVLEVGKRPGPAFIAGIEGKAVGWALPGEQAREPVSFFRRKAAQYIARSPVAFAQSCTDQNPF